MSTLQVFLVCLTVIVLGVILLLVPFALAAARPQIQPPAPPAPAAPSVFGDLIPGQQAAVHLEAGQLIKGAVARVTHDRLDMTGAVLVSGGTETPLNSVRVAAGTVQLVQELTTPPAPQTVEQPALGTEGGSGA